MDEIIVQQQAVELLNAWHIQQYLIRFFLLAICVQFLQVTGLVHGTAVMSSFSDYVCLTVILDLRDL